MLAPVVQTPMTRAARVTLLDQFVDVFMLRRAADCECRATARDEREGAASEECTGPPSATARILVQRVRPWVWRRCSVVARRNAAIGRGPTATVRPRAAPWAWYSPHVLEDPKQTWFRGLAAPHGSFSYGVPARVCVFGGIAAVIYFGYDKGLNRLSFSVGFHEIAGAVIALALAFRTNTGYARFWEGRTLWGAIVNASRNVVRTVEVHARPEADELKAFATWVAIYAHATRRSLREQDQDEEIAALLSPGELATFRAAPHRPIAAAEQLSRRLRDISAKHGMSAIMTTHAERLIADLVDYMGGCERIRKTPTPYGFVLLVRRCIMIFLATLPLTIVDSLGLRAVIVTMLVAYPVLMIEALASELDDPFGHDSNDLPLSRICATIEKNVLGTEPPPSNAPPYLAD